MRVARFIHDAASAAEPPVHRPARLGVVAGDGIADVTAHRPEWPTDLQQVLEADLLDDIAAAAERSPKLPLASVRLLAPVRRPPKFLAIGLNYAAHVAETGMARPEHQTWFNKQSTCVIGPGEAILRPSGSVELDYEGELGFVIGRRCRDVPPAAARDMIAGYLVVNDVTVRDWQRDSPTWTMGKSCDTHGPIGPWLVSADEIEDPHTLRLRTWVNGELRQDAMTDDLVFGIDEMVAFLSARCTLEPGDVISTGTPSGVGMAMVPPRWLVPGDVVRIEIGGVGVLVNPVRDAPAPTDGTLPHTAG